MTNMNLVFVLWPIAALLLGAALAYYFWPYFLRKRLKRKGVELWQECVEVLCSIVPQVYNRPTRLKVFVEPTVSQSWSWRKHYQILVVVYLSEQSDLLRVKLLVDSCVREFLEKFGNRRILARVYYTEMTSKEECLV